MARQVVTGAVTRVVDVGKLWFAPAGVSAVSVGLILGPALGSGVSVVYDMAWSPDPGLTPFALGIDTPAPRAVPSDAVAALLGWVVGASLAQRLLLVAILMGMACGAAALLSLVVPRTTTFGRAVAATAALWNPFVSERLAVGQWAVLLGCAVLPWGLMAAIRLVRGRPAGRTAAITVVVAACGGANSLAMVSGSMLVVLMIGAVQGRARQPLRGAGVVALVSVGASAAWSLPALLYGATSSAAGAQAFVPTSDSPLGVLGSLLGGGGFWNAAAHPESRQQLLVALLGAALMTMGAVATLLLVEVRVRWCLAGLLGGMWFVLLLSSVDVLEPLWSFAVQDIPGGAALRDSQKVLAAWVLVGALGLGAVADRVRARSPQTFAGPATVLLLLLPVVVSPQLFWGHGGRVDAVTVPGDLRSGAAAMAGMAVGDVGLLPWSQYRRYRWNDGRVSLTLAPRMVDRVVLFDDSLPLVSGRIEGESARARAVSERIGRGASPEYAVAQSGVRYVMVERDAGQVVDEAALRAHGPVRLSNSDLLVVEVGGSDYTDRWTLPAAAGWVVTVLTALVVLLSRVGPLGSLKLPAGLLRSRA